MGASELDDAQLTPYVHSNRSLISAIVCWYPCILLETRATEHTKHSALKTMISVRSEILTIFLKRNAAHVRVFTFLSLVLRASNMPDMGASERPALSPYRFVRRRLHFETYGPNQDLEEP
jgi:hypothetical protein